MSTQRAWQFAHPDLDDARPAPGLRLQASVGVSMVEDHAAVRQAILLLLSTIPGERVMRPGYGCNLHRLLFAPNDETTAGLAVHYVRTAVETWEPRVDIIDVDANRADDDSGVLEVVLDYRVVETQQSDRLAFRLHLSAEEL